MANDDNPGLEIFQLKSRVLRAVYYDLAKRKMAVEMTQGKIRIYKNINPELVELLVTHPAPGMLYDDHLKTALKPMLCHLASNLLLLRDIRQVARSFGEQRIIPSAS